MIADSLIQADIQYLCSSLQFQTFMHKPLSPNLIDVCYRVWFRKLSEKYPDEPSIIIKNLARMNAEHALRKLCSLKLIPKYKRQKFRRVKVIA